MNVRSTLLGIYAPSNSAKHNPLVTEQKSFGAFGNMNEQFTCTFSLYPPRKTPRLCPHEGGKALRLRLLLLTPILLCLVSAAPALARTTTDGDRAQGRSLASLLALDDYQIMWLDRIYDGFTRTSAQEDS